MAGFILLPLRQTIIDWQLRRWDDDTLAVLPVLVAHENARSRIARPRQVRIAMLAGVSKTTVGSATDSLAADGWLDISRIPTLNGRTRLEYRMRYQRYQTGEGAKTWLRIERYVIVNGIWAAMPPGTRRLYLTLIALSWPGNTACYQGEAPGYAAFTNEDEASEYGRFVDASRLDPRTLRTLAGIEARTFRRSWDWLLRNEVIVPSDGYSGDGVFLPNSPEHHDPRIIERLGGYETASKAPTPGAKRLITRTYRVIGHTTPEKRTRRLEKRTPPAPQPDISVPEQVFQQTFKQTSQQVFETVVATREVATSDKRRRRKGVEYPEAYEQFWKAFKEYGCQGRSIKANGYKLPTLTAWNECRELGIGNDMLIDKLREEGGSERLIDVSPLMWLRDIAEKARKPGAEVGYPFAETCTRSPAYG